MKSVRLGRRRPAPIKEPRKAAQPSGTRSSGAACAQRRSAPMPAPGARRMTPPRPASSAIAQPALRAARKPANASSQFSAMLEPQRAGFFRADEAAPRAVDNVQGPRKKAAQANYQDMRTAAILIAAITTLAHAQNTQRCRTCERDDRGRIARSRAARTQFRSDNPCPATGETKGPCPGYVIDHIKPLACGGTDEPENMQWQTKSAAHAKDKWETAGCIR